MNLNERISALRKDKGLSQEAVAEALGVSRQAVSKWETGRSNPDTENLIKLAVLFDVSADELVRPGSADIPPAAEGGGVRGMLVALVSAVVVIVAAVIVVLKFGIASQPAPDDVFPASGAISMSEPSAEPPGGAVPSGAQNTAAPTVTPADRSGTTHEVYMAFITVTSENASAAEDYESRLTIYNGLCILDWAQYETCGEAGQNTDTRMALLNWLAGQVVLTAEELSGLISGMNNRGIDGAYCEPYAQALSNALIAYPVQFVKCLAALDDAEHARQTAYMAVYGASYVRMDEAKAAVDSAMASGTLSDEEYGWAVCLKDRCAWWSGGSTPSVIAPSAPS
jgi:DNA-binding XRE family transcriptional regulator